MADAGTPRGDKGGGARPGGSGSSRRRRRGGRGRAPGQRPAAQTAGQRNRAAGDRGGNQRQGGQRQRSRSSFTAGIPTETRPQGHRRRQHGADGAPRSSPVAPAAAPLVDEDEVRASRRRAELVAALSALVPAVVVGAALGVAVSPLVGVLAYAVVLVLGTVAFLRLAVPFTLRLIGARPLAEDELPRLVNLVDGLCPTFGVRRPRLMVVEDPLPNACSVATRPNHGTLVVTTGLESALDLIELEGVLSHELAHLKRSDAMLSAVAVAVLAPLTWASGRDGMLHRLVGRGRELRADQVAVRAVRYPPGLHDALVRFSSQPAPGLGSLFAGRRFAMSRWIWIDPSVADRDGREPGDLDVTSVRIDALAEL